MKPASPHPVKRWTGILFGALGILLIVYMDARLGGHSSHEHGLMDGMSHALALATGFMTSFHCVGMCGALVLTYTTQDSARGRPSYLSHFWYASGKTLSYTLIGAAFGALGSVVAFTPWLRGIIALIAGVFLILFGLSMLNIFPWLRRIQLRTPGFVMRFLGRQYKKHSHPLIIGLLNGLMIVCGPLQAMYIMAAGTGDPLKGAQLLFFFGIGTLPMMIGFGVFASTIAKSVGPKLVKFSSVVVVALGALMLNRGLALADTHYDLRSVISLIEFTWEKPLISRIESIWEKPLPTVNMQVTARNFEPDHFVLQRGQAVRWEIEVAEDGFCRSRLEIPSFEVALDLQPGHQAVEFSPPRSGLILWRCTEPERYGTFTVQ
ncbi:MAG: sulfite exporter TauE/SafE family protein [Methylohalobius sp. ZOD2]|nr:sulfite exporter TauE/SafE family protein [Methylothermaceae bacterium]